MKVCVRVVRGVYQVEATFEGVPKLGKVGGRKARVVAGGVFEIFYKVEVSTHKGRDRAIDIEEGADEGGVEKEVTTRFEVEMAQPTMA